MKIKELKRFRCENLEYILTISEYQVSSAIIAGPCILITAKSSNKNRKSSSKDDCHFKLTELNSPIPLVRKIYSIFEYELKNYDHVYFEAYDDKRDKRERLYATCLKRMGFNFIHKSKGSFLLSRKEIKKKNLNRFKSEILWGLN